MMTQEPKLLTEAEWREIWEIAQQSGRSTFARKLRERGLIAPEPVDEITVELCNAMNAGVDRLEHFTQDEAENLREELRSRGIEIGRAERLALTWEEVRDAYRASKVSETEMGLITRLHAALTEQMERGHD
jgi:hypothetical protein